MGLGVCAEEDLAIGDVLGIYAGRFFTQSVQGEEYTTGVYPT